MTLRIEGDPWRLVKLLSIQWDCDPADALQRLVSERLEHYADPMIMAQLLGAIDN